MDYLELHCLLSTCLETVPLSFGNWFIVWFLVIRGYPLYDVNPFKSLEVRFMAQDMVLLGRWPLDTWKAGVLCFWAECSMLIRPHWLTVLSSSVPWVIFNCSTSCWRERGWCLHLQLWIFYFAFQFYSIVLFWFFLACFAVLFCFGLFCFGMLCSSIVRYIPIQDCCVFLVDNPLIVMEGLSLSLIVFFAMESLLSEVNIATPALLAFDYWSIILPFFYFYSLLFLPIML